MNFLLIYLAVSLVAALIVWALFKYELRSEPPPETPPSKAERREIE